MDNIFTPEEANVPVTYGALFKILNGFQPTIESNGRMISSLENAIRTIGDALVDAEYRRVRDIKFVLSCLSANHLYMGENPYQMYEEWCKEFDRLNKSQNGSEDTNE